MHMQLTLLEYQLYFAEHTLYRVELGRVRHVEDVGDVTLFKK